MRIHVVFYGPIRRPWPDAERDLEVPDGLTVRGLLLRELGYTEQEASFIIVLLGTERLRMYTVLQEGQTLGIMVPTGGG